MRNAFRSVCFVLVFVCGVSFAETRRSTTAPVESYSGGTSDMWFGFVADTMVTRSAVPALSLQIGLSDRLVLQTLLQFEQISPFNFAVGGSIKYSIVGDNSKGIHLGAGFGIGTDNAAPDFFFNFNGIAGLHFQLVERVLISLDGGMTLQVGGGAAANFSLGGHTPNFGASILYRL